MTERTTLTQLLADPNSAAPAVITESPPVVLSYRALAEQIERLAEQLRSAGLRPGDCVVMVLPKGKKDALVTRREFLERAIVTTERQIERFMPGGDSGRCFDGSAASE